MAVGPGDILKVRYKGRNRKQGDTIVYDNETPFLFAWDARQYKAAPGKEVFVPFEAVSVAMGDPRSGEITSNKRDEAGNVTWVIDRPTELRRVIILYDNTMDEANRLPLYAPQADVYDLEGNHIKTVLHDPDGESVLPAQQTVLDRDQLMAQIQRQQRLIEQLAQEQGVELPSEDEQTTTESSESSSPAENVFDTVPEG